MKAYGFSKVITLSKEDIVVIHGFIIEEVGGLVRLRLRFSTSTGMNLFAKGEKLNILQ